MKETKIQEVTLDTEQGAPWDVTHGRTDAFKAKRDVLEAYLASLFLSREQRERLGELIDKLVLQGEYDAFSFGLSAAGAADGAAE